ncbi:MAG: efflux RND transporter periplasmic adaptor subunit [Devosia sp.]
MEQDKIDLRTAVPARSETGPRRSAPLWLQLLISIVVIAAAGVLFILYFPGANAALARLGITLPVATEAAPATQTQQTAQAQATTGGQRQGGQGAQGGQGQRGAGGFVSRQAAVVVVAPVGTATINDKLTAIGEGSALRSATIASASGGTLMDVLVKPGDLVETGQKLAELDSATQQIAYDRATLAAQDADAALARTTELAKNSSVSSVQVTAAQLTADNARLELRNAELALNLRTITTPISGTVGLITASPGNLINAQTVVTTVDDSSEILINFWVPERYVSQLAPGMQVSAQSVALAGQVFNGQISAVDNRIDPTSRTLQVQASLPNPDGAIRAGMSFSVAMEFPGETFAAVDPLSIQWSSDGAYVWKFVDGKVAKAMVEIVQRNTDGVLVKGEVAEGDQVVTQGVLQLSDGAQVRLLDDAGASPAGGNAQAGAQQGQGQRQGNAQASSQGQGG